MRTFAYLRPGTPEEAVREAAGRPDAAFLGGGTNLVDLMKLEVALPGTLVDVRSLQPLRRIEEIPGGGVRIGAAVTNSELAADRIVRQRHPVLSQAVLAGASGQIRNVATVGGNLLQRTRCPYFTDLTTECNKRSAGAGCAARDGHHREHAILGASEECIATHPSDMAVALAALDATVRLLGPNGERVVPAADLHRLPGSDPARDTELGPGELVTGVDVPAPPAQARSGYRKVRDRASFAFALVSVAAVLVTDGQNVRDVRIALGGVAHKPWRARAAEAALLGGPATRERFAAAADAELAAARPLTGNAFKVPLARNTITRTLLDLLEGPR